MSLSRVLFHLNLSTNSSVEKQTAINIRQLNLYQKQVALRTPHRECGEFGVGEGVALRTPDRMGREGGQLNLYQKQVALRTPHRIGREEGGQLNLYKNR